MAAISSPGKVASHVFCHTKTFYSLTPYNVISLPIKCVFFDELVKVRVWYFVVLGSIVQPMWWPCLLASTGLIGPRITTDHPQFVNIGFKLLSVDSGLL